ncbi:hypothetical protein [Nonomuraea sp. NPDC048916]|uniref:hypothetical protein n=1 Tax=Nonomuraea sp. NPDC048916 TaxID=3154232 RepID=UPI0033DAF075
MRKQPVRGGEQAAGSAGRATGNEQAEEETWRRPSGATPGLEADDEFERLKELNPDDFE